MEQQRWSSFAHAPLQQPRNSVAAAGDGAIGATGYSKYGGAEPQRHSAPAAVLRQQAVQSSRPPQPQQQQQQQANWALPGPVQQPWQRQQGAGSSLQWQQGMQGVARALGGGSDKAAHAPRQPQHRLSGQSLQQQPEQAAAWQQELTAHQTQGPQHSQRAGALRALLHSPALRYGGGAGQSASQPTPALALSRHTSGLQGNRAAAQGPSINSAGLLRSHLHSPALRYSSGSGSQGRSLNPINQQQQQGPRGEQVAQHLMPASAQGVLVGAEVEQHTAGCSAALPSPAARYRQHMQQEQAGGLPSAELGHATGTGAARDLPGQGHPAAEAWQPVEQVLQAQPQFHQQHAQQALQQGIRQLVQESGPEMQLQRSQQQHWSRPEVPIKGLAEQVQQAGGDTAPQQQPVPYAQGYAQQGHQAAGPVAPHQQQPAPYAQGYAEQGHQAAGPVAPHQQQPAPYAQGYAEQAQLAGGAAAPHKQQPAQYAQGYAQQGQQAAGTAAPQQQQQPSAYDQGSLVPAAVSGPQQLQQAPAACQAQGWHPQPLQQAALAPSVKQGLRLQLSEWGLPPGVVQAFEDKGVKKMYPWQSAALECGEDYSNLVYCAPTSGGKSLVAEVLMIRRLLKSMVMVGGKRCKPRCGRALVVLPYVSIVTEKSEHLTKVLQPMRATVKGYFGMEESGSPLGPRGETVAVCTMEKANVAINKLVQEGRLGELCCVIVDELHMIADGHRGAGLELALSKLLFSKHADNIQIVGMSATMGGLEALRAWLRARLFLTNYRPVPLTEHAVFQGTVFEKVTALQRPSQGAESSKGGGDGSEAMKEKDEDPPLEQLRELPSSGSRDRDRLVPLVAEVTAEGHSVLVFCATRKNCETCAALIAELLPQVAPKDPAVEAEMMQQRQALLAEMQEALGGAVTAELERCMLQGVAFHHAGLTAEERGGVEKGYRSGCLQVLTATSTLAAGINLPARRVILRSLQQGIGPVPRSQYLQMVGRAGRAGQSAIGESFIIGQGPPGGKEWRAICQLLTAPMPVLQSQILSEPVLKLTDLGALQEEHTQCLQRLLLETVANGSVASAQDIQHLLRCTFAGHQAPWPLVHAATVAALTSLSTRGMGKGLIEMQEGSQLWGVTHKGQAVYDSGLPLDLAMQLYDDLKRADEGVVLGSCLHLLYHCMLEHSGFQIVSWAQWQSTLERLPQDHRRVAEAVGVSPQYAQTMRMGRRADAQTAARHARFAAALAVNDLMSECSVTEVVAKWGQREFVSTTGLSRGQMQKLQLDVSKWMGMAALLCETAGWWPLATLYTNMSQTAAAGVKQELLPLMRIPGMNAGRARVLFKAGLKDPQAIAVADPAALEKVLASGMSQQMKGRGAGRPGGGKQQAAGGSSAPAAMARRAAQALLQSAREYILQATAALTNLAEELNEEEEEAMGEGLDPQPQGQLAARGVPHQQHAWQQQQHGAVPGPHAPAATTAAMPGLTAAEVADIRRAVQGSGAPAPPGQGPQAPHHVVSIAPDLQLKWTKGLARVEQLTSATPTEALQQFLAAWGGQPRFALAVYSKEGEARRPLQALAVCWGSSTVFFLDLSRKHCAREVGPGTTLLQRVAEVLGCSGSRKLVYDAGQQVPLLLHAGMRLEGPVEDPRAAAWLLSPGSLQEVTLKGLHANMAAKFQVRVPSLSKAGVTTTCRTALLTLAVMDPLRKMLEAKGMLQVFTSLEMPAALAAAHLSAASPSLLPAPALGRAQAAAMGAIEHAEAQLQALQEAWFWARQDLGNPNTLTTLLSAMRMPQPLRITGRPVVTVAHLQLLLQRCRPHQQAHIQVLHHLLNYKLCQQALAEPLQALLQQPVGAAPNEMRQQQQQLASPSTAAVAQQASPQLILSTLTPSGAPDWGQPHHAALGLLLASHWVHLPAEVAHASVQEELDSGSLSTGCLPGLPVVVRASRSQLSPGGVVAGGGGTADGAEAEGFFHSHHGQQPQQQPPDQPLLVVGSVVKLSGKRVCTALDFSQAAPNSGGSSGQLEGSQRAAGARRPGMALVRVARLPAEGIPNRGPGSSGGSFSRGGGAEPLAAPAGVVELHYPCSEMWRVLGGAATLLGSGGQTCSGISEGQERGEQGGQAAPHEQQQAAPLQLAHSTYPVQGFLSGQGFFFGGGALLPEGSTLLCIRLQHLELLVLGALSGDPTLLAAARGVGGSESSGSARASGATSDPHPGPDLNPDPDPYPRLSNLWATAAGQVAAGASADGGQLGIVLSGGAARAVVRGLVQGWSSRQLGEELGCSKPQAASLLQSFLRAFPRLGQWMEEAGREGERRGFAATLAGRQQAFAVSAKADAMARGKVHKAMVQFALGGSVADIAKTGLVAVHAAASEAINLSARSAGEDGISGPGPAQAAPMEAPAQSATEGRQTIPQGRNCRLVLAWGGLFVVEVQEGSVPSLAETVRRSLQRLRVGEHSLEVAASLTWGRSLHMLCQTPCT